MKKYKIEIITQSASIWPLSSPIILEADSMSWVERIYIFYRHERTDIYSTVKKIPIAWYPINSTIINLIES